MYIYIWNLKELTNTALNHQVNKHQMHSDRCNVLIPLDCQKKHHGNILRSYVTFNLEMFIKPQNTMIEIIYMTTYLKEHSSKPVIFQRNMAEKARVLTTKEFFNY